LLGSAAGWTDTHHVVDNGKDGEQDDNAGERHGGHEKGRLENGPVEAVLGVENDDGPGRDDGSGDHDLDGGEREDVAP